MLHWGMCTEIQFVLKWASWWETGIMCWTDLPGSRSEMEMIRRTPKHADWQQYTQKEHLFPLGSSNKNIYIGYGHVIEWFSSTI